VVKILAKSLKDAGHYKKKGVVRRIAEPYVGEVEVLAAGAGAAEGDGLALVAAPVLVKIDEEELETVLPVRTSKQCPPHHPARCGPLFIVSNAILVPHYLS
jgi:hypothetical protein